MCTMCLVDLNNLNIKIAPILNIVLIMKFNKVYKKVIKSLLKIIMGKYFGENPKQCV